jgi:hypothetical protein
LAPGEFRFALHSALDYTCPRAPNDDAPLKMEYDKVVWLRLAEPLAMSCALERLGDRLFVQASLACRSMVPTRLTGYRLLLPRSLALAQDHNQAVLTRWICPRQECSLVFEVRPRAPSELAAAAAGPAQPSALDAPDGITGRLIVDAMCPVDEEGVTPLDAAVAEWDVQASAATAAAAAASGSVGARSGPPRVSLSWPIRFEAHEAEFHVTLAFPPHAYVGAPVDLAITVARVQRIATREHRVPEREAEGVGAVNASTGGADGDGDSKGVGADGDGEGEAELLYELEPEPSVWLLAGKRRARFALARAEERCFRWRLLPVACGYLPVPTLRLWRLPRGGGGGGGGGGEALSAREAGSREALEPVSPRRILTHFASQQIYAFPLGDVQTGVALVGALGSQ